MDAGVKVMAYSYMAAGVLVLCCKGCEASNVDGRLYLQDPAGNTSIYVCKGTKHGPVRETNGDVLKEYVNKDGITVTFYGVECSAI